MTYRDNKRDGNERPIIDALEAAGAYVIQMSRTAGFDLLVMFRGIVYIVEVKLPGYSEADITPAERKRRYETYMYGEVAYNVITTPEEALRMIGR